jgi:hypothetical protein
MFLPNICVTGETVAHFLEGFACGAAVTLAYVWFRMGAIVAAIRAETIASVDKFQKTMKGE